MSSDTVAIAADHAGYELKQILAEALRAKGVPVLDLGTNGPDSVDYPDYANALAAAIKETQAGRGVVICGSGIGVSIAANRHPEIRAALCHDTLTARLARQHNDANVLAMGARIIDAEVAKDCLDVFLNTQFEGGRHLRRVGKLA